MDQRQVRSRGSQPHRQEYSGDEDRLDSCEGCDAAIRRSEADRHEDGREYAGQQGRWNELDR